ncbi:MAG: type II secretion system F family protein [Nanopusillaceae archaeon]
MNKDIIYILLISIFSLLFLILPIKLNMFVKIGIIVLLFLIYSIKYLKEYLEEEEMINNFPLFLRDLSHYLKIGQPLPIALQNLLNNNYGKKLDKEVRYMISQMKYGRTFHEVLENSSERIKNREISEVLLNIENVLRNGGDLSNLLDTLSESIQNLNNIKKDRLSQLKVVTYTYYGLYFGILLSIVAIYFLVLNIKGINFIGNEEFYYSVISLYKWLSFILLLINALFTGLVIGKLSKGAIKSGIIHSIILTVISIGFFFLL